MMKRLTLAIAMSLSLLPAVAHAQLVEMRQTIFGMD
jgi:hypothetical protein